MARKDEQQRTGVLIRMPNQMKSWLEKRAVETYSSMTAQVLWAIRDKMQAEKADSKNRRRATASST